MLVALTIRDIVIIDRLSIDFAPGLTVLTGETGAGKSILLDSLSLALGARGDAALVRSGAGQGDVTAMFDVPARHAARIVLRESGLDAEGDIILRRVQGGDGRSRAFVNDQPVSVSLLRRLGATLVEIHGQHDDRAFMEPSAHRELLDAFGGHENAVDDVARAFASWRSANEAVAALKARIANAQAEAEYLRASVEELTKLAPLPDEETELAGRRASMMQAEKIAGEVSDAHDALAGSASPVPALSSLVRRLERKSSEAGGVLDGAVSALDRALMALEEAESELSSALRASEFDPKELEQAEERLFALRAASRKYNVAVVDLPVMAEKLTAELAALESGEENLAALEKTVVAARETYDRLANALSRQREAAARKLEKAVVEELPALKLERAEFIVSLAVDATRISEAGIDDVSFLVRTNPGTEPGPLMKVASGGELARFLLAVKVALADRGSAATLVFDEVDTAVGGAVADAIGARLARLAEKVQVLSVTHAPQVAARATTHMQVAKQTAKGGKAVTTGLMSLSDEKRREEIARMLSGATITDEARAAAERLIRGAAQGMR